jgi:CheY-like chemotaxis protein
VGYTGMMDVMDHILIVDDDRDIRDLLSEYLQKQGYRTTVAADGRAMRAVLSRSEPALIVLDLMLPGEDGLTLCREVRAHSDIPIIMLTARGEEVDRIVGLEMGADDYLSKRCGQSREVCWNSPRWVPKSKFTTTSSHWPETPNKWERLTIVLRNPTIRNSQLT